MLILDLSVNRIYTIPQLYWGIVLQRDTSISVSTDIPGIPLSGSIEQRIPDYSRPKYGYMQQIKTHAKPSEHQP